MYHITLLKKVFIKNESPNLPSYLCVRKAKNKIKPQQKNFHIIIKLHKPFFKTYAFIYNFNENKKKLFLLLLIYMLYKPRTIVKFLYTKSDDKFELLFM